MEALSGLDSSERVSDLANVIGEHLLRFLDAPSSSDLGVSIWHALAWLAGAWSTAIAAPAQTSSPRPKTTPQIWQRLQRTRGVPWR